MSVTTILPIPGVPDELIRILNSRFNDVSGGSSSTSSAGKPGIFFGTKTRPDANGTAVGTFGTDTDTGLVYQVQTVGSSQVWVYASGVLRANFASAPTPGSNDAGLLWQVKDYAHLLRWDGSKWEFQDEMGGFIAGRVVAPDGNGWQLCDGSATHYLHVSTLGVVSEVAFTTPSLTSVPSYLKWAAAYTGALVGANAPSTGGTASSAAAAGNSYVKAPINADAEPAHLNLLPYFRR